MINDYYCYGTYIFKRSKMECLFNKVNLIRTFHLSPNVNICTFTQMKAVIICFCFITPKNMFVIYNA